MNHPDFIGLQIAVFWEHENQWFEGHVQAAGKRKESYHIHYTDDSDHFENLNKCKWKPVTKYILFQLDFLIINSIVNTHIGKMRKTHLS